MTLKARATLAALALCFGLLMVIGASSFKSTAIIKHQRAVADGRNPPPPDPSGCHVVMGIGWVAAVAGAVLVALTIRDMTRQIGDIQSRAEAQLRMEAAAKHDPKSKP